MSRATRRQDDHLGDLVAGLVDGHLDHAAREHALAHLAHCDDCRAEVGALRALRRRLLTMADPCAPPPGLADRLLAAGPPQRAPCPERTRRGPRAVVGVVLVAGVGVCLVTTAGMTGRDRPSPRPQPGPAGVGSQPIGLVPVSSVAPVGRASTTPTVTPTTAADLGFP